MLLAVWIVVVFARQVGEASAAASRAETLASDNATRTVEVEGLARELAQIQRQPYIEQQARGYGLGGTKEIAFTLADDAPPLPDDAPGSASVRLGADRSRGVPARALADAPVRPDRLIAADAAAPLVAELADRYPVRPGRSAGGGGVVVVR